MPEKHYLVTYISPGDLPEGDETVKTDSIMYYCNHFRPVVKQVPAGCHVIGIYRLPHDGRDPLPVFLPRPPVGFERRGLSFVGAATGVHPGSSTEEYRSSENDHVPMSRDDIYELLYTFRVPLLILVAIFLLVLLSKCPGVLFAPDERITDGFDYSH